MVPHPKRKLIKPHHGLRMHSFDIKLPEKAKNTTQMNLVYKWLKNSK